MPTALITGASAGIGKAIAHVAAADGHDVVLVARRIERLEELANDLESAHGISARAESCDLSIRDARRELADRLAADGVAIDVLVNNAGFGSTGPFHELEREWELDQVEVNVSALTDLTRLFLPQMVERGSGRVINIASTAAFQPGPYMAVYYATKAYVRSFSEALWYELKDTGVSVTVHCPGPTESEFGAVSGNEKNLLFTQGAGVATAEEVARDAWKSGKKGDRVAVHGLTNWLGTVMVPFTPQRTVLWLASKLNRPA
jgi:short-subunit dehydrogenase